MKVLKADQVWPVLQKGGSARMTPRRRATFSVGDAVIAKRYNHPGHIRLPQYVQGCQGTIAADHGAFIFPDQHARGIKEPQQLYSVRFEAAELRGENKTHSDPVYVDLFESYLRAV